MKCIPQRDIILIIGHLVKTLIVFSPLKCSEHLPNMTSENLSFHENIKRMARAREVFIQCDRERKIQRAVHLTSRRQQEFTSGMFVYCIQRHSSSSSSSEMKRCFLMPSFSQYPELDTRLADGMRFGVYLCDQQARIGGFFPIFWSAPYSCLQASTDLGLMVNWIRGSFNLSAGENGCLAVLHNRNDMVNASSNLEWLPSWKDCVLSREVTSCAGMTARAVLLAQGNVGFLAGGRSRSFRKLSKNDQAAQREEAYARATVAFTDGERLAF